MIQQDPKPVSNVQRKLYHDIKFWSWWTRTMFAALLTIVMAGSTQKEVWGSVPIMGAIVAIGWLVTWFHYECSKVCREGDSCKSDHTF